MIGPYPSQNRSVAHLSLSDSTAPNAAAVGTYGALVAAGAQLWIVRSENLRFSLLSPRGSDHSSNTAATASGLIALRLRRGLLILPNSDDLIVVVGRVLAFECRLAAEMRFGLCIRLDLTFRFYNSALVEVCLVKLTAT